MLLVYISYKTQKKVNFFTAENWRRAGQGRWKVETKQSIHLTEVLNLLEELNKFYFKISAFPCD